jgi:hypothetical protein
MPSIKDAVSSFRYQSTRLFEFAFVIGCTIPVPRAEVWMSSFISLEVINSFLLEFQAVSDAYNCKSKYCPSIAGPRAKQQQIKYCT